MPIYVYVVLIAGALTVTALWSYGPLVAIASAPFGASAAAACSAVVVYVLRREKRPKTILPPPTSQSEWVRAWWEAPR